MRDLLRAFLGTESGEAAVLLAATVAALVWPNAASAAFISIQAAPTARPRIFVCGPTAFVERADDLLVDLGHDPTTIRSERFGPTGG